MTLHKLQLPELSVTPGVEIPIHVTASVMRLIGEYHFFYLRDERLFYANGNDFDIQYKLDIDSHITWFDVHQSGGDIILYLATSDHGVLVYRFVDELTLEEIETDITGLPATRITVAVYGLENVACLEKDFEAKFYRSRNAVFTEGVCSGLVLYRAEKYEVSVGSFGFFNVVCRYNGQIRYDAIPWEVICRPIRAIPVSNKNIIEHTPASATWEHEHGLGSKDLMIYAFSDNNISLNITDARILTDDKVEFYWSSPIVGKSVVIGATEVKALSGDTWTYSHSQGDAFVQFYDDTDRYIEPSTFTMTDSDISVNWGYNTSGSVHIMDADISNIHGLPHQHWDEVDLNEFPLWLAQYYDNSGKNMQPYFIMSFTTELRTEFNTPTLGQVVLKGVQDGIC